MPNEIDVFQHLVEEVPSPSAGQVETVYQRLVAEMDREITDGARARDEPGTTRRSRTRSRRRMVWMSLAAAILILAAVVVPRLLGATHRHCNTLALKQTRLSSHRGS